MSGVLAVVVGCGFTYACIILCMIESSLTRIANALERKL